MTNKKFVFIDLLFSWPPIGGASVDIYNTLKAGVMAGYEPTLVTILTDRPNSAKISEDLPFPAVVLPYTSGKLNVEDLGRRIRKVVDQIDPAAVFVAETWGITPYIIDALKGHKVVSRIYAYEPLCPLNGTRFKDHALCENFYTKHLLECHECLKQYQAYIPTVVSWEFAQVDIRSKEYVRLREDTFANAHSVFVYNKLTADMVTEMGGKPVIVTGGVDADKFTPASCQPKGPPRILMTGRVDDYAKGFHFLRHATHILKWRTLDFMVQTTSNINFKSEFIESVGWNAYAKMQEIYQDTHILAAPSLWEEPFGLVALEAMACRIPVVASRVGGLQEIVEDGVTGFVVTPKDAQEMADKLEVLIKDPGLRSKMGEKGRERVLEKYTWEKVFKNFYLPVIDGRG